MFLSEGTNLLEAVSNDGARIRATAHGGQLLSWSPSASDFDLLFVSSLASFAPGSAIRGGVPVIFPQFADRGPLQKHGFARNVIWQPVADQPPGQLRFELRANANIRQFWDHEFALSVTMCARGDELSLELNVAGDALSPETMAAFHTYIRVPDVRDAHVAGLEAVPYIDTSAGRRHRSPDGTAIRFGREIDRIYTHGALVDGRAKACRLITPDYEIHVSHAGFTDTVVWNPGPDVAARIGDLGAGEWQHFVCIEGGVITRPLISSPEWSGTQTLRYVPRSP
ncbi:MAG: D-hexose-6-phosphate mutarotase [Pseudomonadota bacterium]